MSAKAHQEATLEPGWLGRQFKRIDALKSGVRKIKEAAQTKGDAVIQFSAEELAEVHLLTQWHS